MVLPGMTGIAAGIGETKTISFLGKVDGTVSGTSEVSLGSINVGAANSSAVVVGVACWLDEDGLNGSLTLRVGGTVVTARTTPPANGDANVSTYSRAYGSQSGSQTVTVQNSSFASAFGVVVYLWRIEGLSSATPTSTHHQSSNTSPSSVTWSGVTISSSQVAVQAGATDTNASVLSYTAGWTAHTGETSFFGGSCGAAMLASGIGASNPGINLSPSSDIEYIMMVF